jgi:phage tail sheath gpL-like
MYMKVYNVQPDVQQTLSGEKLIESVYLLIKNYYGGRATTKQIEKEMDNVCNKRRMLYAILRLTRDGKIKRVRGFGSKGIEYYYTLV